MMSIARRQRPAPYLPFISLADIAWQIIIFFLIASTFLKSDALDVPLPTANPDPHASTQRPVVVTANESSLSVDGREVDPADLEATIASLLARTTREDQRAVVVRFADDVTFGRNAKVLYAVEHAGGVVVISDERDAAAPSPPIPQRPPGKGVDAP